MKNKKIIISIVLVITLFVIIYVVGIFLKWWNNPFKKKKIDNTDGRYIEIQNMMNESKPTTVYIYGDDLKFGIDIKQVKVDKIEDALNNEDESKYKVLIINDLYDNAELTDDEINALFGFVDTERNLLIYLGKKYANRWKPEYLGELEVEGNLYYDYYSWNGVRENTVGSWNERDMEELKKYPHCLWDVMIFCIKEYYKTEE